MDKQEMTNKLDSKVLASLVEMGAIPAPESRVSGPIRWQAVFFIGPAASGKSFVKTKKYLRHLDFKEVDPDEIKKSHPDYDPENPFELHAWSKALAQGQLNEIMTDGSGSPVIVDGTGRNFLKVGKNIKLAEKNGYRTYLVYVYVPLEISIWRNRNRERFVPETVIMEQTAKISNSYKQLRSLVDKAKVIIQFGKPEQKIALEDMEVYPPPQPSRPPRPGDPDYGIPINEVDKAASKLTKEGAMDNRTIASELVKVAKLLTATPQYYIQVDDTIDPYKLEDLADDILNDAEFDNYDVYSSDKAGLSKLQKILKKRGIGYGSIKRA